MTGPEHYREAERLLEESQIHSNDRIGMVTMQQAQVHATLALTAATALPQAGALPVDDHDAWWAAAGNAPVGRAGNETPRPEA